MSKYQSFPSREANDSESQSSKKYNNNSAHQQMQESDNLNFVNSQDLFEVQAILDKRIRKGKPQYLIKWLDWDQPHHNTWQGMENLRSVKNLIQQFEYNLKTNRKLDSTKGIRKQQKQKRSISDYNSKKQRKKLIESKYNKDIKQKNYQIDKTIEIQTLKQIKSLRQIQQLRPSLKKKFSDKQKPKRKNFIDSDQDDLLPVSTLTPFEQPSKKSSKNQDWIQNKQQLVRTAPQNQKDKYQTFKGGSSGYINGYYIEGEKLVYQLDILSKKGNVIGVRKVESQILKLAEPQKLREYLQQQLMIIQRYEEMRLAYINKKRISQ